MLTNNSRLCLDYTTLRVARQSRAGPPAREARTGFEPVYSSLYVGNAPNQTRLPSLHTFYMTVI